jgi:serine protease Do
MKKQIRLSTALLLVVIAIMAGAIMVTMGGSRNIPIFVSTAHAAAYDQGPLTSFAPVVKRVMPAIVNISSSKMVKSQQGQLPPGLFDDPFFRQFFGRMPQQQPRAQRAHSLGSGVVVSPDGYILTNNHVVEGATDIKVAFSDKREYPAKIVGTDQFTDVAVIKIDQKNLPVLALSDSSQAQVGDVCLAVGNPFGLGQTVTMGIVSATGRAGLGIERFEDFIQTDAPINPGNSGGALINTRGELIGINTAILAGNTGGNQGIGFAIPVNLARNVMEQILKHGKVSHGYIGIVPQEVTPDIAKAFGIAANTHGVAIAQVEPNSPGSSAGLQVGDVITAVNGTPVSDVNQFRLQVAGMSPGSRVNLRINRNGHDSDMPVTLGEFKMEASRDGGDQNPIPNGGEKGALQGVSVQALTPDLRRQLQIPEGTTGVIITELDESSAAAQAGLEQGDIIVQVNRKPVNSVQQFNQAVRQGASSDSTVLLVKRAGGTQFLVVPNK